MKSLWFKEKYVKPILSGEKNYTIRKKSNRNPNIGEIITLTVGPRPPFAKVKIIDKTQFLIPPEMKDVYDNLYPNYTGIFEKIVFTLIN